MPENSEKGIKSESLSPEWKHMIIVGIRESLDNYELFDRKLDFSPVGITCSKDERGWAEISDEEREFILKKLFEQVGFDPDIADQVATYQIEAPTTDLPDKEITWTGKADVNVYTTQRALTEDMYLHEIVRLELETEYIVAPVDFRL